jgi:beta-lactamase regulating signal transducer with metallopeptidase domain
MPDLVPISLTERFLCWVAETTLVAMVLALVALLAARWRRLSPAARHALWVVVLVKLMTPPLVHWPWSRAWLPPAEDRVTANAAAPVVAPSPHVPAVPDEPSAPPAAPAILVVDSDSALIAGPAPVPDEPDVGPVGKLTASSGGIAPAASVRAATAPGIEPRGVATPLGRARSPWTPAMGRMVLAVWLLGSIAVGAVQAARIGRFRERLRGAEPAPSWLVAETARIGRRIGVRAPEIRIVASPGTPVLWCLGRPVLLIPRDLALTLESERWPGILAHELAHLRRGDHWISRLALAAGMLWWWSPVYWLARRRLEAEAELACDAWVVWTLPCDRVVYAESLFRICSALSLAKSKSPSPSLGVAGPGRFFERRLTMILSERASCRLSAWAVFATAALAALALPSWTTAMPVQRDGDTAIEATTGPLEAGLIALADDDDIQIVAIADDPDPEDDPDDADDDDDDPEDDDADDIVEKFLGPDFEKRMEEMGERIGKEMEAKFGPDSEFVKQMEKLGEEMEAKFGPDSEFARQMEEMGERIGKEMEAKFGPDSEFVKQITEMFGPDSEFAERMEAMGREMAEKFGPGSEFAERMSRVRKDQAEQHEKAQDKQREARVRQQETQARQQETQARQQEAQARQRELEAKARREIETQNRQRERETQARQREAQAKARADQRAREREARSRREPAQSRRAEQRDRRIQDLEARIERLLKELEDLKEEGDPGDDEEN